MTLREESSAGMVAFAIPHRADFKTEFVRSLFTLNKPPYFVWQDVEGMPVDAARNQMAARLAESNVPVVLWLDDDMILSPSTLGRLWRRMEEGCDIVSALYFGRTNHGIPMAYNYDHYDADKGHHHYRAIGKQVAEWMKRTPGAMPSDGDDPDFDPAEAQCFPVGEDDLLEVDGIGFGCVLMKTEVLRKMTSPYFVADNISGGGEDFYFCREAKKAGFRVYVDLGVHCGHLVKGGQTGRLDFADTWALGTPDEFNWEGDHADMHVDVWGRMRVKPQTEPADVVHFADRRMDEEWTS